MSSDNDNDSGDSGNATMTPMMTDDDNDRANANDQDNNENKEIKMITTRKMAVTAMATELTAPTMTDDYGNDDNTTIRQQQNIDETI